MSSRMWRHYIDDMLQPARRAQGYTTGMDYEDFVADQRTIDAVVRNLIVIGEAARRIPQDVALRWPGIPWRLLGDMRNFVVHEYFGVSLATVWQTIRFDLADLCDQLEEVLRRDTQSG